MNKNDKFSWQDGDIRVISEDEFLNTIVKYDSKPAACTRNPYCDKCDKSQKALAEEVVSSIFNAFFVAQPYDESVFRRVMQNLSLLCKKVLGKKCILTKELYYCIKSLLIAEICKKTHIQITPAMIEELYI